MESNVNREIRNYHEGVVMGLSVRQTVCGLLAAGLAAAANFGLQPFLGTELASVVCILAAAIPAAIGFVSFHGLPFENSLFHGCARCLCITAGMYTVLLTSMRSLRRKSNLKKAGAARKQNRKSVNTVTR